MVSRLLTRLIERASDFLASAIYQRILDDRCTGTRQAALPGAPTTWKQILARAMKERILNRTEARELLGEIRAATMTHRALMPHNAPRRSRTARARTHTGPYARSAGRRAA
jgi:hypothetical protein